jgi:hypothetical protein
VSSKRVSAGAEEKRNQEATTNKKVTHLVLVHNPALELVVPALMAFLVLDHLID